jgi:uncharacterized protein YidB (DUF937 family)
MSGILGQVLGLMGGQGGQSSPLAGVLQQLFVSGDGTNTGVAGLVGRFQNAGLGEQAQSWVSTGSNLPLSADQVGQVFPAEQLRDWAAKAGTTPEALQGVLAQAIPHVVDHMTPEGQVPAPGQMPDFAGVINKLFGGGEGPRAG